jgi:hypothetical protein
MIKIIISHGIIAMISFDSTYENFFDTTNSIDIISIPICSSNYV